MSQYATVDDFQNVGLPVQALADLPFDVTTHLVSASGIVDTYLRGRYTLPLTAPYPQEVVTAVAVIAAYTVIQVRGYDPENGTDRSLRTRYEDVYTGRPGQKSWLQQLAGGLVNLDAASDASPGVAGGGPIVSSRRRGTTGSVCSPCDSFWVNECDS